MSKKHRKKKSSFVKNDDTSNSLTNIISAGKEYTIGDFIKEYRVVIPMLQRDYAQGREGKEFIRKRFLSEIREAIHDGKEFILDFVYGYGNNTRSFFPLDGQQRLTTVWLVYWYLAFKAKQIENEKDILIKFSYETRKSSREFCEALCLKNISFSKNTGIVQHIQNQTWFYAEWKKDPTVSSMLRTLGGTENGDDGIEPVFRDLAIYANKWEYYLNCFKSNIKFYVLNIGNRQLPTEVAERLYVKMNARGKALTDFENFKADFIDHLKNDSSFQGEQLNGRDYATEISARMDNDWNDVFWKSAGAGKYDGQTDELFFTFINRFCFNQICVNDNYLKQDLIKKINDVLGDDSKNGEIDSKKKIEVSENEKDSLKKYKYFTNESQLSYEDFHQFYKDILNYETVDSLSRIFEMLKDHLNDINSVVENINSVVRKRESTNYHFLPCYKFDDDGRKETVIDKGGNIVGKVAETTYKERLYFFAITQYLSKCNFQTDSFARWMRFSRNIIENSGVDSVGQMITCMRNLASFNDSIESIHKFIASQIVDPVKTKYDKQLKEEIAKAKQTIIDYDDICKAEDYSVFCGRISFLFTDKNGTEDWSSFNNKFYTVKSIFDDNTGTVDNNSVKNYAGSFDDFNFAQGKMIFHQIGWKNRGDNWLDVLCEDHQRSDSLLTNNLKSIAGGPYKEFLDSKTFFKVIRKEDIMSEEVNLRIANYNNKWALYRQNAQKGKLYFDNSVFKRGQLLKDIADDSSITGFCVGEKCDYNLSEKYYWGEDIDFVYNGKSYVWTSDDKIYECVAGKKKTLKLDTASSYPIHDIISKL